MRDHRNPAIMQQLSKFEEDMYQDKEPHPDAVHIVRHSRCQKYAVVYTTLLESLQTEWTVYVYVYTPQVGKFEPVSDLKVQKHLSRAQALLYVSTKAEEFIQELSGRESQKEKAHKDETPCGGTFASTYIDGVLVQRIPFKSAYIKSTDPVEGHRYVPR